MLDHFYNIETPATGLDDRVNACLATISSNYLNGNTSPALDLSCSTSRLAYLYQYFSVHSRHLAKTLTEARKVNGGPLFTGQEICVACLGGGPGTDAVGVLKYLRESSSEPQQFQCCVLDNEPAWNQNWQPISQLLGSVTPFFAITDATVPMSADGHGYVSTADLITISYLVSAVQKYDANNVVTNYFQSVFSMVKKGALIVYVDNAGSHTSFFDSMLVDQGLTLVRSWDYQDGPKWGSFGEDLVPLDLYKDKFAWDFKISAKLSYRVLRKT